MVDDIKVYTEKLFNNCTELISYTSRNKQKYKIAIDTSRYTSFEYAPDMKVIITSHETVLCRGFTTVSYKSNMLQFSDYSKSYVSDVIYIPSTLDYSFYKICTDDELFQLSTVVDIKLLTIEEIRKLNAIREYFEYNLQ